MGNKRPANRMFLIGVTFDFIYSMTSWWWTNMAQYARYRIGVCVCGYVRSPQQPGGYTSITNNNPYFPVCVIPGSSQNSMRILVVKKMTTTTITKVPSYPVMHVCRVGKTTGETRVRGDLAMHGREKYIIYGRHEKEFRSLYIISHSDESCCVSQKNVGFL